METPPFQTPRLEHLCDLLVDVSPPIAVGETAGGLRRLVPITGGTVIGPKLQGRVLPAGADFQQILEGTTAHLDARYVIELSDETRVFVHNRALRHADPETSARLMRGEEVDPARVYFRCQPRFETASPQWRWLEHYQFIGTGVRRPGGVQLRFYQVL